MKPNMKKLQAGFTLIELMIGMLIGLIAVAATISAFTSIVRSNSDYLKMVRLNQELNAVMTLMTRDLKRAGYSGAATGVTSANTFMNTSGPSGNDVYIGTASVSNDCILFSYDADNNGALDVNEKFGYRRDPTANATAVELRESGEICNQNVGSWNNITDEQLIQVNTLTFIDDVLSVTSAGLGEIRYIGITLTGQLKSDASVKRTITERVRVRNDRP